MASQLVSQTCKAWSERPTALLARQALMATARSASQRRHGKASLLALGLLCAAALNFAAQASTFLGAPASSTASRGPGVAQEPQNKPCTACAQGPPFEPDSPEQRGIEAALKGLAQKEQAAEASDGESPTCGAALDPWQSLLAGLGLGSVGAVASGRSAGGDNSGFLPRALLFLFALLCSTNFTTLKLLGDGRSESAVATVRFALAALPTLPFLAQNFDRTNFKAGIEIGLWCAFAYISQAIGLQTAEASHGAFICSLAMVVVPTVKAMCGAEVKAQIWGAVALAVTGTALLIGLVGGTPAEVNFGDFLCGGCALGFGLMFVRMDDYAKEPDFEPIACTMWQCVALALSIAAWHFATFGLVDGSQEVIEILSAGPQVIALLVWVGLVTTAGVLFVETWAMEQVDGTEAGVIFASEPVWATLFASMVLGESFGAKEGAGAVLILLACLLTQVRFSEVQEQRSAAAEGA